MPSPADAISNRTAGRIAPTSADHGFRPAGDGQRGSRNIRLPSPPFSTGSWSARRCPAYRAGKPRSAMRGHRASGSTHSVGRRAPPFGSHPGARPLRRGPQPYSLIRFSARFWRIERLGVTQAVTLVRKAGCRRSHFSKRSLDSTFSTGPGGGGMSQVRRNPIPPPMMSKRMMTRTFNGTCLHS